MYSHNSLEICTTGDMNCWDDTLKKIGEYDFFHLAAFHKLAQMQGEGEAVLLTYTEGEYMLAFPLLLRNININFIGDTDLKDATSVAGLAGPVATAADIPEDVKKRFHQHLQDFFEQNSVLSVYSRLNPLLNQPPLLEGYGEVVEIGVTQSIDLTPTPDEQYMRYRRNHRRDIKRLQEMGFICEEVGIEGLDEFMRIYIGTMKRLNADEAYFLDKSYFEYLMKEMSDVVHLFICRNEETVVCAKICTACNGIVLSLLGGTDSNYLKFAPAKILYDTIRIWGNGIRARVFHMGGSIGGKRDSLSDYKMGFGAREHVYSTWRHIVNQEKYNELCREVWQKAGREPSSSYFPSYRHPELYQPSSQLS